MAYKLNKKWFRKNGCEEVVLENTRIDFCYKNTIENISNNQAILKEIYEAGKEYVTCEDKKCDKVEKSTKNIKLDGIKEAPGKKEAKQVSAKASSKK